MANQASFCHVFLSFRGETRNKFTCFLYEALKAEGFVAFMDKSDIRVADEVDSTIQEGIKSSMSSIIVFSQNYAYATWCLDELVLILERSKNSRYFIIPIFYEVEPRDIKHQLGNYGLALEKHRARHSDRKIEKWRQALFQVGNILGDRVEGLQSIFIQNTVKLFREKLAAKFPKLSLKTSSSRQPSNDKVILYLTSINNGLGANGLVKKVLISGDVVYEERNCTKEPKYFKELEELVGKDNVRFPMVIVNGKDLCGEEEVEGLDNFENKQKLIHLLRILYTSPNLIESLPSKSKTSLYDGSTQNRFSTEVVNLSSEMAPEYGRVNFEAYEEEICVGFDGEANHLLDRLASHTIKKLEVMSIVGMGGLGKTTLARRLYNDPLIVYQFYVRGWVSFSQVYRKREILLRILSSVIELTDEVYDMDANVLAQVLYRALKCQKYLIVVDDLWNIEDWEDIKRSFPDDNNGSKILVTTRLKDVALHAQSNGHPHFLRFLTEDESFDLFRKKNVLAGIYFDQLTETGKEITRKCGGLPLAIVVVAGLLRTSFNSDWWKQVAQSLSSDNATNENHFMDTLALSYNHLPHQLRSCFLYFAALPEDTEIQARKLIWLWIAEGFICKIGSKSLEDVAQDYLMDLVGRSLVVVGKKGSTGAIKTCRIHDLLHDLCMIKAKEERFLPNFYKCTEHSYSCAHCSTFYDSPLISTSPNTQLCLTTDNINISANCPSSEFFRSILKDITIKWEASELLRALDLSSIELCIFPNELLHAVHLRYLELRFRYGNPPESISHLTALETIIMSSRRNIVVPENIWKMVNIRHLCIKSGENLLNFSYHEERILLENLQTMSLVSPTRPCEHILARTPNLLKLGLCGPLITKAGDLKCPDLGLLEQLETLKLLNTTPPSKPAGLSASIIFPEKLKRLTLSNTTLDWKEAWIFEMIPNLEVLKLKCHAFVGEEWETSNGIFPRLKFLRLDELDIVTWTISTNHFPVLQRLEVHRCPHLLQIPIDFGNIFTLEWIEISGCSNDAIDSARDIQKEQENNGNDCLKILLNLSSTSSRQNT